MVMGPCRQSISWRKDLLLSLPNVVLSLSLTALLPYFFTRHFFCDAPQLTEHLTRFGPPRFVLN